ncbi:MAG: hypothetical protein DHS20C17_00130 [Cyclobacteriaceae bacterium]|nr:MAG: hypothetical protein DHS20C17_00130 [Cyclobacteriaceae bacterium]
MIIYGWNSKNIKQAELDAYQCPKCGEKKSVLAIFAHYLHIFWIPLFPFKKSAKIVCAHCQLDTEEKTLPDEMKVTIRQLKSKVSHPKSLFSGLIVIFIAVAFFSFRSVQNANLEQSYVENPQVGDVYIIKGPDETSEYNHFLFKINEIEEDSIWVSFSSYTYNGLVDKLDSRDGFYDIMYSMHKGVLVEFQESGELKKVLRDYTASAGFDRVIEYTEPDTSAIE